MRTAMWSLGLLAAFAVPAGAADEITIAKVNVEEMQKAIAAEKGKIVVVDIWATFCAPCKEKFPHMVELHHKLKEKGVVFMSLSVDEADAEKDALAFLKDKKATFGNFLLVDTQKNKDAAEDKFATLSPPIVHVYGRDGKKVKTMEGKKEIGGLDKLLEELIEKK